MTLAFCSYPQDPHLLFAHPRPPTLPAAKARPNAESGFRLALYKERQPGAGLRQELAAERRANAGPRKQLAAERKEDATVRKELAAARGAGRSRLSGETRIGRQGSRGGREGFRSEREGREAFQGAREGFRAAEFQQLQLSTPAKQRPVKSMIDKP